MTGNLKSESQKTEIGTIPISVGAWIVFTGQSDLSWLKILRPGFRHCYALLNDGTHWVSLDPLSNYTDITVHNLPPDFNLPLWLEDRGMRVVKTPLRRDMRQAPWMPFTCVEAVKRVIGLHARSVITPWQLYRHLTTANQGELSWEA